MQLALANFTPKCKINESGAHPFGVMLILLIVFKIEIAKMMDSDSDENGK